MVTIKSVIKYLVRKNRNILSDDEYDRYINSGNNIESLSIINLIHGYCSSTRAKLSVVPESIDVLQERNNWEEWPEFLNNIRKGLFCFLFFFFSIN